MVIFAVLGNLFRLIISGPKINNVFFLTVSSYNFIIIVFTLLYARGRNLGFVYYFPFIYIIGHCFFMVLHINGLIPYV